MKEIKLRSYSREVIEDLKVMHGFDYSVEDAMVKALARQIITYMRKARGIKRCNKIEKIFKNI